MEDGMRNKGMKGKYTTERKGNEQSKNVSAKCT